MKILPELPNLEFLSREAKTIRSQHRNRDVSVCQTIGHYDTSLHGLSDQQILDKHFSILDAQRVVARRYGFSSWTKMKRFVTRSWEGQKPTDFTLHEAILERYKKLESLQKEAREAKDKKLWKKYRDTSLESTHLLNCAFDCHGWPGPEVVGPRGVWPIMYLSANAVYDAKFQYRSVALMEKALTDGGISARWQANLLDRNLVLSNKPCVYGSAFGSYYNADGECELLVSEVIEPENLEKRRARVGLSSMEMEKRRCVEEAKEHEWELPTRGQSLKELKQLSIAGGYAQQ